LAFEGLTPQVIARRTATKQAQVKQGLKVAENPFATTAIAEHQLTVDQAADLIESEGEDDTVASLIEVATKQPEQFAHTAQRARDEKALAEQLAQTCVELREKGFTILESDPGYYDTDHTRISNLLSNDGERVTIEDIAEAADRAAFVRSYYSGQVEVIYYLADFKTLGFRKSEQRNTSGPMSDDDKAARRVLIANNKAWASAQVVRREWLTTLLWRRTMPRSAGLFVALGVTQFRTNVSDAMGRGTSWPTHCSASKTTVAIGHPTSSVRSCRAARPERRRSGWRSLSAVSSRM
jgi:ParB family chromosome partitioning protein